MTLATTNVRKNRSAPITWIVWAAGVVAVASVWVYRRIVSSPQPLTKAQEKQRRKALVREMKQRK